MTARPTRPAEPDDAGFGTRLGAALLAATPDPPTGVGLQPALLRAAADGRRAARRATWAVAATAVVAVVAVVGIGGLAASRTARPTATGTRAGTPTSERAPASSPAGAVAHLPGLAVSYRHPAGWATADAQGLLPSRDRLVVQYAGDGLRAHSCPPRGPGAAAADDLTRCFSPPEHLAAGQVFLTWSVLAGVVDWASAEPLSGHGITGGLRVDPATGDCAAMGATRQVTSYVEPAVQTAYPTLQLLACAADSSGVTLVRAVLSSLRSPAESGGEGTG